jgi:two-component sensor histidine kinase
VKALSALGIIVNELLTNVMKYAFEGRAEGLIRVSAKRRGAGATLTVRDDGVGLPESVGVGQSKGFGLMLIDALTKHLEGTLRIERGGGTAFVLDFGL